MIREFSLPIYSALEFAEINMSVGESYGYSGYVIAIRKLASEGPCPSTLNDHQFGEVKNDYLLSISSSPDGEGINTHRQILSGSVIRHSIKIGTELFFLQKRGCVLPDGLSICLGDKGKAM